MVLKCSSNLEGCKGMQTKLLWCRASVFQVNTSYGSSQSPVKGCKTKLEQLTVSGGCKTS